MDIDLANLPSDTEALQALVRALAGDVKSKGLLIEQLKAQIAKLRRMQFGKSSEKINREIEQLELQLDELYEDEGTVRNLVREAGFIIDLRTVRRR